MHPRALRALECFGAVRLARCHQRRLTRVALRLERVGRAVVEERCRAAIAINCVALLRQVGAVVATLQIIAVLLHRAVWGLGAMPSSARGTCCVTVGLVRFGTGRVREADRVRRVAGILHRIDVLTSLRQK